MKKKLNSASAKLKSEDESSLPIMRRAIQLLMNMHPWVKKFADAGGLIFGGKVWRAIVAAMKEIDPSFAPDIQDFYTDDSDTDVILTSENLEEAHKLLCEITEGNIVGAWDEDYGIKISAHFHASPEFGPDAVKARSDFPDRRADKDHLRKDPLFDISVVFKKDDTARLNPRFSVENICFRRDLETGRYELEMLYPSDSCKNVTTVIGHIRKRMLVAVEPNEGLHVYHANPIRFVNRVLRKMGEGWIVAKDYDTSRILYERCMAACDKMYNDRKTTTLTITNNKVFKELFENVKNVLNESSNFETGSYFRAIEKMNGVIELSKYDQEPNGEPKLTVSNARWIGKNRPELLMELAKIPKKESAGMSSWSIPLDNNAANVALAEMARIDREEDFRKLLALMNKDKLMADMRKNGKEFHDYYTNSSTVLEGIFLSWNLKYFDILEEFNIRYSFSDIDVHKAIEYHGVKAMAYFQNKTVRGAREYGNSRCRLGRKRHCVACSKTIHENVVIDFDFLYGSAWHHNCTPDTLNWLDQNYILTPWHVVHFAENMGMVHFRWSIKMLRKVTPPNQERTDVWKLTRGVLKSGRLDYLIEYVDYLTENHPNASQRIAMLPYYDGNKSRGKPLYVELLYEYYSMFHFLRYLVDRFPDFIPPEYFWNDINSHRRRDGPIMPIKLLERIYYPESLPEYVNLNDWQRKYDQVFPAHTLGEKSSDWLCNMHWMWYHAKANIAKLGIDITGIYRSEPVLQQHVRDFWESNDSWSDEE